MTEWRNKDGGHIIPNLDISNPEIALFHVNIIVSTQYKGIYNYLVVAI